MNKILEEIKKIQNTLGKLSMKFAEEGLDEFDAEEAVEALEESLSINRVLFMELKRHREEDE